MENLKLVATTLMKFEGSETKVSAEENARKYLKYRCPKPGCSKPFLRFFENSVYINPYRHIFPCLCQEQGTCRSEAILADLSSEARNSAMQNKGAIRIHFQISTLSGNQKAFLEYIKLALMNSLPLSIIANTKFRAASRFSDAISTRRFIEVIFQLVEIVKRRVSEDLKGVRGRV